METATKHGDSAIRSKGLTQAYSIRLGLGRREVLHGVDLELARGASLGLVGPNGSGKSTLLRVFAGIEPARAGALLVLGGSPRSSSVRRRIGFVSEESPFPRELGARAALELCASLWGLGRAERKRRSERLLERVGLASAERVPLGRFSRGMSRRFALAAALIHEPDLLLLDEPTAGLDALGFAVLEELLGEARARGTSLVIASHLLTDIQAHCERLIVLVDGRVVLDGTPRDLSRAQGSIELELRGLGERELELVEARVRELGGSVDARRAAAHNLIELYRREARDGRR